MEKNTKNLLFINEKKEENSKMPDFEVWIGEKKYVFWKKTSKSGKVYGYGKEKKAQ